jgi:hypothetical protein
MSTLAGLRRHGLRVKSDAGRILVEPRAALTDALRSTIRINKGAILRELSTEAATRREAIIDAREAAPLKEYRAALLLGRLHICGNCSRYSFGPDPAGPGSCLEHGEGLLAFRMPFQCSSFQTSRMPAAPDYIPQPDFVPALERL